MSLGCLPLPLKAIPKRLPAVRSTILTIQCAMLGGHQMEAETHQTEPFVPGDELER